MEPFKTNAAWRWTAAIMVFANVLFNYAYTKLPHGGKDIGEVSDQYANLFTPASYAFSIWGLIYLSFIIFAIYQLLPSQRSVPVYDRLSKPFAFANFLGSLWIVCFTNDMITASVFVMLLTLATAMVMFSKAKDSMKVEHRSNWITVPFSLFFGWITVATIANVSAWLVSMGWHGGGISEPLWAIALITVALGLGIVVSSKTKDLIYPLVIAWATLAISMAAKTKDGSVAITAFGVGVLLIIWTAGFVLWEYGRKVRATKQHRWTV